MSLKGFWERPESSSPTLYRFMSADAPDYQRTSVIVGLVDMATSRSIQLTFSKRPIPGLGGDTTASSGMTWLWSWAFEGLNCWRISKDGRNLLTVSRPLIFRRKAAGCMNDLLLPLKAASAGSLTESVRIMREERIRTCRVPGYRPALKIDLVGVEDGFELNAVPSTEHRRVLFSPAGVSEKDFLPAVWPSVVPGKEDLHPEPIAIGQLESWDEVLPLMGSVFPS